MNDIHAAYEKFAGLYEKFAALLSNLPTQNLSFATVPASTLSEPVNIATHPMTKSEPSLKKSSDQYAQPIAILSTKATMSLKSSTRLLQESNDIVDKITYFLETLSQQDNGLITSKTSSLKIAIEQAYQRIQQLKKEVDTLTKKPSSQDILTDLNTPVSEIQNEKTNIVEANTALLAIVEKLFELPRLTTNVLQKNKLFSNQTYIASDALKGRIEEGKKHYNDLNTQFNRYTQEGEFIKKEFNLLWKNKATKTSELSDKIQSLHSLKNEKIDLLQQKMNRALDPIWSLAVDKHQALIETIENKRQETSDQTALQSLNQLKQESEKKFKDMTTLHQEYQSKMPSDQLLEELFDKKQKETNLRLKNIIFELHNFSEQQEKQLKKITA